jgi:uncharacterized protein (TIGR03083 family)
VDHRGLVDALRREGAALGAVPLDDVDVPTCPEWNLPELVTHVGWVHRWQAAPLRTDDPDRLVAIDRSAEIPLDELSDWYHDGFLDLLGALDATPPDRPCPSFAGPRPATFWARRAAHETAIHRWDAEAATGRATPLDPAQAVDIVDEMFEVVVPRRFDPAAWEHEPSSIHLHATDLGPDSGLHGEWLVVLGSDGVRVTREHAKGDVAARGTISDLALLMTGRLPPARLEVFGDTVHLDRWFRAVRF